MTVRVFPAETDEERDAWIALPRRAIYSRDSPWVPPLDADLRRALDPEKNPFFQHGTAVPLLAADESGRITGRVLAHVYHRHNVRHDERTAFFGYFESRDDVETARALIRAAAEFGARHDCDTLRGPFNMTAMQELGILLDGFGDPPSIDESYTPPYYPALLAAAGLQAVFPVTTFRIDDLGGLDPDALLQERHRALLAEGRLRTRQANMDRLDDEIEVLRELLNDSFYTNPHFVPITREEFSFQLGPFKRLVDPAIITVAELDGVPCAFALALPDFNPLLKRMRGSLGPRALVTFLVGRRRLHDAALIIMGVQRQLQGQGVMRILQAELVRSLRQRGYRRLTVTWVADVNDKSLATFRALHARPWHRLTLFEAPIAALLPAAAADTTPAWLAGARGAPSAHNTQPWLFTPRADGRVTVRWRDDRTLTAGDPTSRDLYLALGAAVEAARLRSAAAGAPLAFVPAVGDEPRTAGELVPAAEPAAADLRLAALLDARHTARTPHLRRPVPAAILATLQAEARQHGRELYIVHERRDVKRLARLARTATAAQFADPAVHEELWRWLRLDPGAPAYRRDGLTAECLELRGTTLAVARATMPPARMRLLSRLGLHHLLASDTERTVRRTAVLCLLTSPGSTRANLVETGRVLLRLWLLAAEAGLATHPVSALLDCAATAGDALAVFGATGAVPAALFRLGFTPAVARAPRLPDAELVEQEEEAGGRGPQNDA